MISLLSFPSNPTDAAQTSECKIKTSPNQVVSLGFPLAPERLANKSSPKILVIPFRLTDTKEFEFTDEMKTKYFTAAENISDLSSGKIKVNFVFAQVLDVPYSKKDMINLKSNQQSAYNRDENSSTFGFVRNMIISNDKSIDFSGVDSVFLQGPQVSDQIFRNSSYIAEAFMFFSNPTNPWFRPIETKEGLVFNAVLTNGLVENAITITHELLHNFGLIDLYGSNNSPSQFSIMADQYVRLLSYEKWVLGWLPDSQVQCMTEQKDIDKFGLSTQIKIPNSNAEHVVVINSDDSSAPLIIETSLRSTDRWSGPKKFLAFYSLNNEARPPINLYPDRSNYGEGIMVKQDQISQPSAIGQKIVSEKFTLLISDINEDFITLDLIPQSQIQNIDNLLNSAERNRQQLITLNLRSEQDAKLKAEAEAKAKAEAEAKARAEAEDKAKAEAEAKAKVVLPISNTKKIISIICVKGKLIKKVNGYSPKCPVGYIKK